MSLLNDALFSQLEEKPSATIFKDAHKSYWYQKKDIKADVSELNHFLQAQGIAKGDVVVIWRENSVFYAVAMQALWQIGAVARPVADTLPAEQVFQEMQTYQYAYLLTTQTKANDFTKIAGKTASQLELLTTDSCALVQNKVGEKILSTVETVSEQDLALLMNTSGTTGEPKRVGLSHEELYRSASHIAASQQLSKEDRVLILMPLFHINAQVISLLATRLSDGKAVIAKNFSARLFWQEVSENQITWVSVVPTIIKILSLNQKSRSFYSPENSLKYLRSASFNLQSDDYYTFEQLFHLPILEGYGMTESASLISLNPIAKPKLGSVGLPVATEVRIATPNGLTKSAGITGEIALAGDHVIKQYLDPHAESFVNDWLLTGDLGYFDAEGYLFLVGRKKEMINHGGEKFSPIEVEQVLNRMQLIKESAVVGCTDDLYGQKVIAFIILENVAPSADCLQAIMDYSEKNLPKYQRLAEICFVSSFPRSASGKIQRSKLSQTILSE